MSGKKITEEESKMIVERGFEIYKKKLFKMCRKAGEPLPDENLLEFLYNAYNTGFTAGMVFTERYVADRIRSLRE